MTEPEALLTHVGGCHCGLVKFEVDAPAEVTVDECTCSICSAAGFIHLIVTAEHFRLLTGEERLSEYRFGTGIAKHLFCDRCGVKSFYRPRSHPDGYSVNFRCLDQSQFSTVNRCVFDGEHWETNVEALRSRD